MKGLELARAYYQEHGKKMLEEEFPAYAGRIACGIAGEGSENLGFDDMISRDHDFGAGFCMWLTDEDYDETGKELHEAYLMLPKTFGGFPVRDPLSYGERRLSAIRISSYYKKFTNCTDGPKTLFEWAGIPEHFLAAATSGEVFYDPLGKFTEIRNRLLAFYPDDVRLLLIGKRAFTMGQAGQYNYPRCVKRGEMVAANLALAEFINAACSITYLLNRRYSPYYKWAHRGIRDLPVLSEIHGLLNDVCVSNTLIDDKAYMIEQICVLITQEMKAQKIIETDESFLANLADEVYARIKDDSIRGFRRSV